MQDTERTHHQPASLTSTLVRTHNRCSPRNTLAALGLAAMLVGCQSTAGLPGVDDTQRRPINSAAAIELQSCKAEATALRATLLETAAPQCSNPERLVRVATQPGAASAPLLVPAAQSSASTQSLAATIIASPPTPAAPTTTRVAIFTFEQNQVTVTADEVTRAALKTAAENAAIIHVRGRSGSSQETPADTQAARRRAEGAAALLKELGVPPQKLRVSWQGMADAGNEPGLGRRVEIEFVERAPVVLFTRAAGDKPAPTAVSNTAASASEPGPSAAAPKVSAGKS